MIMMNRMQVSLMAQEPGVPWRDLPERHGSWNSVFTRHRHQIENFCCRIKAYPRIATRHGKLAVTFLGFIQLAAILDWLSHRF